MVSYHIASVPPLQFAFENVILYVAIKSPLRLQEFVQLLCEAGGVLLDLGEVAFRRFLLLAGKGDAADGLVVYR